MEGGEFSPSWEERTATGSFRGFTAVRNRLIPLLHQERRVLKWMRKAYTVLKNRMDGLFTDGEAITNAPQEQAAVYRLNPEFRVRRL